MSRHRPLRVNFLTSPLMWFDLLVPGKGGEGLMRFGFQKIRKHEFESIARFRSKSLFGCDVFFKAFCFFPGMEISSYKGFFVSKNMFQEFWR